MDRERQRENISYNYTTIQLYKLLLWIVQYAGNIPAEGSLILMSSSSSH